MDKLQLTFELIDLVILIFGFTLGIVKLFKKGKPLYFQLFVCAAGCRTIEKLICTIILIFGFENDNIATANFIGMFSTVLFILSANRGTIDDIVDDKSDNSNKKAKKLALFAPISSALIVIGILVLNIMYSTIFNCILLTIVCLPCIWASYFSLKHLLLKKDELGILESTKGCNILVLIMLYLGFLNQFLTVITGNEILIMLIRFVQYGLPTLLVFAAIKGANKWNI